MTKYYYKTSLLDRRSYIRILSLLTSTLGVIIFLYVAFPLLSWQLYFAPAFSQQKIEIPIPKSVYGGSGNVGSLLSNAAGSLTVDYTNARNWYPSLNFEGFNNLNYSISIPKINIDSAKVSSADYDLTRHMVQFNKDTAPGKVGNTIIFGHSTLPQLFNPNDYKTILANAYKIGVGDEIIVTLEGQKYTYKVQTVTVVEPNDTSVLAQDLSDSFITLITCTPPGTVWKRLIIKAKLT
ncbi:MAG: Sortase family protein [Candidatus Levybacteria bacterium GW2011_GWA2_40_8]|nr:MAG: Sortase family protein [Candidatus Levybacteria bacterium GW2011_GWA2_40_8]